MKWKKRNYYSAKTHDVDINVDLISKPGCDTVLSKCTSEVPHQMLSFRTGRRQIAMHAHEGHLLHFAISLLSYLSLALVITFKSKNRLFPRTHSGQFLTAILSADKMAVSKLLPCQSTSCFHASFRTSGVFSSQALFDYTLDLFSVQFMRLIKLLHPFCFSWDFYAYNFFLSFFFLLIMCRRLLKVLFKSSF